MDKANLWHILLIAGIVLICSMGVMAATTTLTLEIQGKQFSQVPYIIENNEVMVPARMVVEEFGGKLVWHDLLKVFVITFDDGYEVKMQVGSPALQTGDQVKFMPVAPRQVNGQVMIPLRFFAQQFGFLFKWDAKNWYAKVYKPSNWVMGVNVESGADGENVVIACTKKVTYKTLVLTNPNRIVIDFDGSLLSTKATNVLKESYTIENVKIAQFDSETVRVVLELNNPVKYNVREVSSRDGFKLKVDFEPGIREIAVVDQGISIKSSGEITNYKIVQYTDPQRLVIDLPDQTLQLSSTTIPLNFSTIKQARASQYSLEPRVARLVLDLTQKIEYTVLRGKSANEIIIQPKNSKVAVKPKDEVKPEPVQSGKTPTSDKPGSGTTKPTPSTKPGTSTGSSDKPATGDKPASGDKSGTGTTKPGTSEKAADDKSSSATKKPTDDKKASDSTGENVLVDVGKEYGDHELISVGMFDGPSQRVVLKTSTPVTYKIYHLTGPERLVIDLNGATTKLSATDVPVNKGDIKGLRIQQHPDKVRIVFDLNKFNNYKVLSAARTQTIDIGLGVNTIAGKIIVVDPGHGGSDPGAIGASGTYEKDITLAVSLKLRNLLRNAGATVIMTRETDVYPMLNERTELANQLNADIFVCIHCNSLNRVDPGGTETFYAPKRIADSGKLAQAIQRELVKSINLFDRGVKSDEFYVLNRTNMPSALVETAFISKKDEETLLLDPNFQDKIAKGIYQGIMAYFGQTSESGDGK